MAEWKKQTNNQKKTKKKTGTQGKGIKQLAIHVQPPYIFMHVYMEKALCFYLGHKRFLHSIYWLVCESLQSMLYILLECFVFRVCAQFICTILMHAADSGVSKSLTLIPVQLYHFLCSCLVWSTAASHIAVSVSSRKHSNIKGEIMCWATSI